MARKRIKPVDFSKAVKEVLDKYGEDVYTVLDQSVEEVADDAARQLQNVDSFAPGRHPSGDYAKSWGVELDHKTRLAVTRVVRNFEHYRLTHLLENGHVSRNGTGRTFGRVRAYPHIAPVDEWVNRELPVMVERKLGKL